MSLILYKVNSCEVINTNDVFHEFEIKLLNKLYIYE